MASPFDYINAITSAPEDPVAKGELDAKDYGPFIVNRGLSLYPDTVLLANEMNKRPEIPKEVQYKFLYGSVSKKRRFSKWPKKEAEDAELVEAVCKAFKCSVLKAESYVKSGVFTEEAKLRLLARMETGGARKR